MLVQGRRNSTIQNSEDNLIGSNNSFNNFEARVNEKLKPFWGREVYRIRDFDVLGNPFVIVLKKPFAHYTIVVFTNLQTELKIGSSKWFYLDKAEKWIQKERNKLIGNKETGKVMNLRCYNAHQYKEKVVLPTNHVSDNTLENEFAKFVEKCVLCSFRGEELYRLYGTTVAGQHFCFVVSKTDYYIVLVVLEPNKRPIADLNRQIKMYSRTMHLLNMTQREKIDSFVAETTKEFADKRTMFLSDYWAVQKYNYTLKTSPLETLQSNLCRGDHLRRNLKVGCLKPTHHDGIYLGDGQVAHYTTDNAAGISHSKSGSGAGVVPLDKFLNGEDTVTISYYISPSRTAEHVAVIAEYLVNDKFWEKRYDIVSRNCQLFANLCTTTKSDYRRLLNREYDNFMYHLPGFILLLATTLLFLLIWLIEDAYYNKVIWTVLFAAMFVMVIFVIVIIVWCFQKKSITETMEMFTEIEEQLDVGLFSCKSSSTETTV